MHVSVQETVRMTAELFPTISGLQGGNAFWVIAQCAARENENLKKVQNIKSKSLGYLPLTSSASCIRAFHSATGDKRPVDPAKSDKKNRGPGFIVLVLESNILQTRFPEHSTVSKDCTKMSSTSNEKKEE